MASEEDLLALPYNQLRKAAKALGIPATGKKADLAKRIAAAGANDSEAGEPPQAQPAPAADSDDDDDDEAAPEGVSFAQAKEQVQQQEAVEAQEQEKSMTGKKRHRQAQIHPDDKAGAETSNEASGEEADEFGDDLAAAAALLEGGDDSDSDSDSGSSDSEGRGAAAAAVTAGPRKRGRTEERIAVESAVSKPAHRSKQVGNVHIVFGDEEEKVKVGGGARQFVKQSMFRPDVPRTTVDRRHKRSLGAAGSFAVQADGSYGTMPAAQREAERARAARASERALVAKRKGKLGKSSRSSTARVPGSLKRHQIATGAKPKATTVQRPGQGLGDDDDFL